MDFLFFFFSLLGLTRAYTDPKCLQVDISFVVSTGNTAIPNYINTTVRNFVKKITDSFSTPDEVPPGSRQFARFAFYTNDINSNFMDYTRNELNNEIKKYITCVNNCQTPDYQFSTLVNQLNSLTGYKVPVAVTTNRVGIIITDQVTSSFYDTEVLLTYPLIFAVGIPGTNGNMGRQNMEDFAKRIGGHPERVFPTIKAALDPETGIISQIANKFTAPSVTCSGFGIFYNYYIPNPYDDYIQYAAQQMIYLLNTENNGFKLFPYSWTYVPGFYGMEAMEYIMIHNFRLYDDMRYQTSKYWLQSMLYTLQSGLYNNYGFLVFAETDFEQYMNESLALAKQIAEYNVLIYVIDATVFYEDKQELFTTLTRGIKGRIINTTDSGSAAELTALLRDTFVKDFNNLGCQLMEFSGGSITTMTSDIPSISTVSSATDSTVTDSSVSTVSFATDSTVTRSSVSTVSSATDSTVTDTSVSTVSSATDSTVTRSSVSTVTGSTESAGITRFIKSYDFVETSEVSPTVSGRACSGIIFISEMTSFISSKDKVFTFDLIRELKRDVSPDMEFAYAQYGTSIYRNLNLIDSATFEKEFSELFTQYLAFNQPTGNLNRLSEILNQLLNFLKKNSSKNFAVLLIAESHAIFDPSEASTVAQSIAELESNIYVLDYSTDSVPNDIWNTLTGFKSDHILKGTNLTLDQMTPYFVDHLIFDIDNDNC